MGFKMFGVQFGQTNSPAKYSVLSGNISPLGDLSKPFINERYQGGGGYILFGADNLYPQMLSQLYYTSPLHRAISDFKCNAVAGNGFETTYIDKVSSTSTKASEKIKQAEMDRIIKMNSKMIAQDLILHSRVYLRVIFNEAGLLKSAKRIDPVMVRHNEGDIYGTVTKGFISKDWAVSNQSEVLPILEHRLKGHHREYLYMYKAPATGIRTYSLPDYATAANWMFLDGEVSYLHKSNIINSINPSFILNFPRTPANKQEMGSIKDALDTKGKGAKNTGRVITLFSKTKDQMPEVITAQTSQNDKLFLQTSLELKDNICFSHQINPSIIGIKVAGSLGSSQELQTSWEIFNKNVIRPLRETLEEYFNDFINITGLTGTVEFLAEEISFEEEEVSIVTTGDGSPEVTVSGEADIVDGGSPVAIDKEAESRANLRGSVGGITALIQIQTSVASGLTDRESAIAMLEIIYGFSRPEAERMLGSVSAESTEPKITE